MEQGVRRFGVAVAHAADVPVSRLRLKIVAVVVLLHRPALIVGVAFNVLQAVPVVRVARPAKHQVSIGLTT